MFNEKNYKLKIWKNEKPNHLWQMIVFSLFSFRCRPILERNASSSVCLRFSFWWSFFYFFFFFWLRYHHFDRLAVWQSLERTHRANHLFDVEKKVVSLVRHRIGWRWLRTSEKTNKCSEYLNRGLGNRFIRFEKHQYLNFSSICIGGKNSKIYPQNNPLFVV